MFYALSAKGRFVPSYSANIPINYSRLDLAGKTKLRPKNAQIVLAAVGIRIFGKLVVASSPKKM